MVRIIVVVFLLLSQTLTAQKGEKSLLFVGSSSTYCHDLPLQVSEWLNNYAGWKSRAELVGRSGTGFQDYMKPGFNAQYGLKEGQTLTEKIESGKYDYVVVQQITYFMGDKDSLDIIDKTRSLCNVIRNSGAKIVFYEMGWRLGPENETGRNLILREAQKNKVHIYVPCSQAWKAAREKRPDIELHNLPDTDHPGTLGTYLNLCCFYASFTGKSPVGLPADIKHWPRFGAFDKEEARKKLETLHLDYYHQVMPEWMKMISAMTSAEKIDKETALYLQEIAWKVCKQVKRKL